MGSMRFVGLIAAQMAVAVAVAPATAGTFEVKTPDITKGEVEFSVNSAVQSGFPPNADPNRYGLEVGLAYSPTAWFLIAGKGNLDQAVDANWVLSTMGVETQLRFGKAQPGFDFGWYTAVDVRVFRDNTNTLTFGPILQFGDDKASLTLNPFFAQTFGTNREDGIAFTYAVKGKIEVQKGLGVGFEAYGTIPNIGRAPGVDFQEHRIGPVLYLEGDIGSPRPGKESAPKARLDIGGYWGLTEATPDFTAKAKLSITW